MARQLQIKGGIAHSEWIGSGDMPVPAGAFDYDNDRRRWVARDSDVIFVDVTDRPDCGVLDLYDRETDTFSHPPPPPDYGQSVDAREFMLLFTQAERKAIRNAAKLDEDVADFMELVRVPVPIRLKHPVTQAGLASLVTKNLLAAPRAIAIQNRQAP